MADPSVRPLEVDPPLGLVVCLESTGGRPAWKQLDKVWKDRKGRTRVRADHSKVQPTQDRAATPVWAPRLLEDNKHNSQARLLQGI